MRKLSTWQKVALAVGGFIFLSWLGLVLVPAWWFMFIFVPVGIYAIWHGSKHGWKIWQRDKEITQKLVKVLTSEQAKLKIKEYCDKEDILIIKKSPRDGETEFSRNSGRYAIPFYVLRRYVSQSKQKEGWAYLICDQKMGAVSLRGLGTASFTDLDIEAELDRMGGGLRFIERVIQPEQRGPISERIRVDEPVPQGEENA